jgi:decaprenylphospho-beta-D-ribofuranose 2-oxidase
MHPLDAVINWNRIYGKKGFIQYQFVIPFTAEAVLFEILHRLKEYNCKSSLSVLKTLGPESPGSLSFPLTGWTVAIDFPNSKRGLSNILLEIDHLVVSCGGRIYLCKDSRVSSELISRMYPKINEWRTIRNHMDPNNKWRSDQSRRLKLC